MTPYNWLEGFKLSKNYFLRVQGKKTTQFLHIGYITNAMALTRQNASL